MTTSNPAWVTLLAFLSHGGIKLFLIGLALFVKYKSWSKENEKKRAKEEAKLKSVKTSFEMGPPVAPATPQPKPAPVPATPPIQPSPPSAGGMATSNSPWSNADPFESGKKRRR